MPIKLANRAKSTLAAAITDSATTITVQTGEEGRFPSLSAGEWFPVTVVAAGGAVENMKCTARSGVTLTVTRAQEGTSAQAFAENSKVELRLTAGALAAALADASELAEGEVPDAVLPARLKASASVATNANSIAANGFYQLASDASNIPVAAAGLVLHQRVSSTSAVQTFTVVDTGLRYIRSLVGVVWSDWAQLPPALDDLTDYYDDRYADVLLPKAGGTMTGPLLTAASVTGGAGLNIAPGVNPTAPVNGDLWATGSGLFARIGGVTWSLAKLAANIFTAKQTFVTPSASTASVNLPQGAAPPDTPANGDLWMLATGLFARIAGATQRFVTEAELVNITAGPVSGSWITVTNIRAKDTNYRNTYGKDILFRISEASPPNLTFGLQISIDTNHWITVATNASAGGEGGNGTAVIVPAGFWYRYSIAAALTPPAFTVYEYR